MALRTNLRESGQRRGVQDNLRELLVAKNTVAVTVPDCYFLIAFLGREQWVQLAAQQQI